MRLSLLLRLCSGALLAFPASRRDAYGEELLATCRSLLSAELQHGGSLPALQLALASSFDILRAGLRSAADSTI